MQTVEKAGPSGVAIVDALKAANVEFVAALPDIWTSVGLLWPLSKQTDLPLIRLCKEDEGISICSGLAYARRRAVVLMQYTGLLDSINAIRGAAVEYDRPVCMIVGLLGKEPDRVPAASDVYGVRMTPGILDVMGIDYACIEGPEDVEKITAGIERAYEESRPFVALIGRRVER
jgi:sulfopyruvate decarboxylase subunit beta